MTNRIRLLALLALLAPATASAQATTPAQATSPGETVVRAMRDRYAGKWYSTLTFVQKSSFADGRVETWYEAIELPGRLRIDMAPLDSANAALFRSDSLFSIQHGAVVRSGPRIHPLLLLGFDVYFHPVEKSVADLRSLRFDMARTHEATWQERPVIVVGALAGDSTSTQFWVDKERLVFVRLLQRTQNGVAETQFNEYRPLGGGWISTEVRFFTNGAQTMLEEYSDVRTGMRFEPTLFVPSPWTRPGWVKP